MEQPGTQTLISESSIAILTQSHGTIEVWITIFHEGSLFFDTFDKVIFLD